jgi:hypothetical protein
MLGEIAMPNFENMTIEDAAYAMDGGSIYLSVRDSHGVSHALILVQHRIPMDPNDPRIPGRLYLDNRIIKVRSEEESNLLSRIQSASISPINYESAAPQGQDNPVHIVGDDIVDYIAATKISPKMAIRYLVDSLLQFVKSEEYVWFADSFRDDNFD